MDALHDDKEFSGKLDLCATLDMSSDATLDMSSDATWDMSYQIEGSKIATC
jgi:hypothetical protein